MQTTTGQYSIKDVALLTGLPASTLRYYESIGVLPEPRRGETSGHRVYSDADLELITWVACLSATGMPVGDMRRYLANNNLDGAAASDQIDLLLAQQERLATEAENLRVRRRYVELKIDYWRAIEAGDDALATRLSAAARALADDLKQTRTP